MAIKYGKFELPANIKIDQNSSQLDACRIIAEPFEKGFGHTVGNALRRVLLTSLEAPAIVSIGIEGAFHEYTAIEGIIEDMTHIILNLKRALLRKLPFSDENHSRSIKTISKELHVTQELLDVHKGQYIVTLKELVMDSEFEVVNPDMKVFTVTAPMKRLLTLRVMIGRGYTPSEALKLGNKKPNEVVIDGLFSPVRLVNYYVENCRVGGETDMDRLVLDITTDGRITAKEALTFAAQIGILHLSVFDELKFQAITYEEDDEEGTTDRDAILNKLALKINEIELSVRSTNCLAQANIDTIAELVIMSELEMLKFRNFGKKSLNEIKAKLEEMGLQLGMDLSKYGITRENVRTLLEDLKKGDA